MPRDLAGTGTSQTHRVAGRRSNGRSTIENAFPVECIRFSAIPRRTHCGPHRPAHANGIAVPTVESRSNSTQWPVSTSPPRSMHVSFRQREDFLPAIASTSSFCTRANAYFPEPHHHPDTCVSSCPGRARHSRRCRRRRQPYQFPLTPPSVLPALNHRPSAFESDHELRRRQRAPSTADRRLP